MSRRRHPNERNPFPPFDSGVTRLNYGHRPSPTPSPLGGQPHGDSSPLERFSAHLLQQPTTASLIAPFLPRLLNATPPPNAGEIGRNQFLPQSQPPPPLNLHDPMSHHRPDHPSGRHDSGFHWHDPDGYQYKTNPDHRYNQFSDRPLWNRPDDLGGHRTDSYHTPLERPPLSGYSEPRQFETRPSLLGRGDRLFNDNRHFDDREAGRNPPLLIPPREHATRVSDTGYRSYEMMPPDELRSRDYPAPYNAPGSRDLHMGSMPQDVPMRSLQRHSLVGSMPSNEFMPHDSRPSDPPMAHASVDYRSHDLPKYSRPIDSSMPHASVDYRSHDLPKYSRPIDSPMPHASVDYRSHDLPKYSRPGNPPVGSMPHATVDYRPHDSPYEPDLRSREHWSLVGPRTLQPSSSTSPFRDEDYSRMSSPSSVQSNPSRGSSRGSTFRGSPRDLSTSNKPDWSGRLRRHSSDHGSTTSGQSSGSGSSRESSLDRGSRRRDRERWSCNERDHGRQRHSSCDEGKSMSSTSRDRSKKDYGPGLHSPITTSPLVGPALKDPSLGRLERRLGPKIDETTSLRSHSPSTNLDLSRNSLEDRLGPEPSTCVTSRLGPSPEKPSIHARLGPKISGGVSLKSDRSVSPAGECNLDLRVKLDERKRSSASKSASSSPVMQASPKLQLPLSSNRGQSQATSSGDKPRFVTPEHPKPFSADGKKNILSMTSSAGTKAPITHVPIKRKSPELAKSVTHPPPSQSTQKQQASMTPPSSNAPSHHAPSKRKSPELAKSVTHPPPSRSTQKQQASMTPPSSNAPSHHAPSKRKSPELAKSVTHPPPSRSTQKQQASMTPPSSNAPSHHAPSKRKSPELAKSVTHPPPSQSTQKQQASMTPPSSKAPSHHAPSKRNLPEAVKGSPHPVPSRFSQVPTTSSETKRRPQSSSKEKEVPKAAAGKSQQVITTPSVLLTRPEVIQVPEGGPKDMDLDSDSDSEGRLVIDIGASTAGDCEKESTHSKKGIPCSNQEKEKECKDHDARPSSNVVATTTTSTASPLGDSATQQSIVHSAQLNLKGAPQSVKLPRAGSDVARIVAKSTSRSESSSQQCLIHAPRPLITTPKVTPPLVEKRGDDATKVVSKSTDGSKSAAYTTSGVSKPTTTRSLVQRLSSAFSSVQVASPRFSIAVPLPAQSHSSLSSPQISTSSDASVTSVRATTWPVHRSAMVASSVTSGGMPKGPPPTHGTLGHPHQPAMVATSTGSGAGPPTHGTQGHPHQLAMVASSTSRGAGPPTHGTLGHPHQPAVVVTCTSTILGTGRMPKVPLIASIPSTLGYQPAVVATPTSSGVERTPKVPSIIPPHGTSGHPNRPAVVASSTISGAERTPKVPLIASIPSTLGYQPSVVATSRPHKVRLGPAEKFAKVFIGTPLVEKLAMIKISGHTILQRFRQNISKTFGCFRCWTFQTRTPVDVSFFLRRYFKGFYTATLTETWAKNHHARDLFREELEFLHKQCQEDTSKWLERTETYDWICKFEFRKGKIQDQWEKMTAATSQVTVPNVTLRAKTGEVVRLEPSSYRLKCQKSASALSSREGPYNQDARDSRGGRGRYYLSKLPSSSTELLHANVVIEDVPVPPSTGSLPSEVASSNQNTGDVFPEVDRDEVIVIDSSSDETGEDLVRTNEAPRLIHRSPSPSRLIQKSPSPSRLIQRSPSPSRLIQRSPSPSDQEVRAITSNSLPGSRTTATAGSLQGRLGATSQVKYPSLCNWGTEILTTALSSDSIGDATVMQTGPRLSDGLDPHMPKDEAPPPEQVSSSVQVTESEISVLKQLEKELESGLEQVRNLELNRPLTVESYEYNHQPATIQPIMHTSTEMPPRDIPSPPAPTTLPPVSYDRDNDIIADSRPHAQVPDKSGSLSPGEIVSPTPSFEEIIDRISTDAARGINQDTSVLPLGGISKNSSGSQHEPGLTRLSRSRHESMQYRSSPRWGRERSRSRSFSPRRGHAASKRLPSPPRRTSSRYHQGLSSHSPGARYRSGYHSSERGMESLTATRSTRSRPWSSRSRSRSPSSRDQERGSRSSMSTRSRTHGRGGEKDGSGSTRRGYGIQHGTEDKPHGGYSPRRSLAQKSLRVFDSDDDLELLELRKDAIMSMIGEEAGSQREGDSGKGNAGITGPATSGRRETEMLEQGGREAGLLEAEAKEPRTTVAEQGTMEVEQGMAEVGTSARTEEGILKPEVKAPEITEIEPGMVESKKMTDQPVTVEKQRAENTVQEVVPSVEEVTEVVKPTAQQPLSSLIPADPERPQGNSIVVSKPSKTAAVEEKRKAKSVSPTPVCVPRVPPRLTKLPPHVSGVTAAKPLASKPVTRQPTPISQPSSRAGSRFSSPVSSVQSPPMFPSAGGSKVLPLRKASMSVKVISSDTMTWEVPECRIQLSSGEEMSSSESDSESAVTGWEIDAVLSQFRRVAEAKAKLPSTQGQEHTPSPLPECPTSETSEPTSPLETLNLPRPPDSLPPDKKQEYMALQRKLALHEKRVSRQEVKRKGKGKEKSSSQPEALVKSKPRLRSHTVPERPTKRLKIKRPALKKVSTATTTITTEEEGRAKTVRRETRLEEERRVQEERRLEEERRVREERRLEEEKRVQEEKEKRVAGYEQAIRDSRSNLEKEQHQLTSLTHQLIDCESEVEECELKMELLRKQLKLTEESYAKAKNKSSGLQDKVRQTKEQISKHTSAIQEAERNLTEANTSGHPPPTTVEENSPPLPDILIQEPSPLSASVDDDTLSVQEGIVTATGPLTTGAEFPLFPCVRIQELLLLSDSIAESKKPVRLRTASSREKTAVLLKVDAEPSLLSDYERVPDTQSTPVRVARSAAVVDAANSSHLLKPSSHGLIVEPISDAEDGLSPISIEMVSDPETLDPESQNKISATETEIESPIVSGTQKCNLHVPVLAEVVSDSETLELESRNETCRTPLTESSGAECEQEAIPKEIDTMSHSHAPCASPAQGEPKDLITTSRPPAPLASSIQVEGTPKTTSRPPAPSVEPISDSDEEELDVVGTPDSLPVLPEMNEVSSHENMASNKGVESGSVFSLKITSVCSLCPDPILSSNFEVPQAIDQASTPLASDAAMTVVPQAIDQASDASVTGVPQAIDQASTPLASDASMTGVSCAIDQASTPLASDTAMAEVPHTIDQASDSEMAVTSDREPNPSIPNDTTLPSSAHSARIKVEHNYSLPSELIHILCAPPSSSKPRKSKGNAGVSTHSVDCESPSMGALKTGAAPERLQIPLPEVESVRKASLDKGDSFPERPVERPGIPNQTGPVKQDSFPEKQDSFPEKQDSFSVKQVIERAVRASESHPEEEQSTSSDLTGEHAQQSGKILTPSSLGNAPSNNEAHKPGVQPALSLEQQGERSGVEARSDASPGSPQSRRKPTHPRHLCLQPLSPSSSEPSQSRRKSCKPKRLLPSQAASSVSPVFNQTLIYSALSPKLSSLLSPASVQKVVDYFHEHSSRPGSVPASESTSRTSTLERAVVHEKKDGDDRPLPSRQPSTTPSFVSVFSTSQTLSSILTSALKQSLVSCSTNPQAMLPGSSGLQSPIEISSEDESTLSELTTGVSSPGIASEEESYKVSAVSKFRSSCGATSSLQSSRDSTVSERGQASRLDAASLAASAHVTSPITVTISATSVPSAPIHVSTTVTPALSSSGASTGLGAPAGINLPTVFLPMTVPCPPLQLSLPSLAATTLVSSSSTVTSPSTSFQSVTSPTVHGSTSVPTGKHPSTLSGNIPTPTAVKIPIPKVKPTGEQPSTTPTLPTIFLPMAVPHPSSQPTLPLALPLINFPLCYFPQLQSTSRAPSSGSSLASAASSSLSLKASCETSSAKGDPFSSQAASESEASSSAQLPSSLGDPFLSLAASGSGASSSFKLPLGDPFLSLATSGSEASSSSQLPSSLGDPFLSLASSGSEASSSAQLSSSLGDPFLSLASSGSEASSSAQLPSLLDVFQRQRRGSVLDIPYVIEAVRRHIKQRSIDFSTGVALVRWLIANTSQNPSTLSSLNPELAPTAVSGIQRLTASQSATPLVSLSTFQIARALGLSSDSTLLPISRPSSTVGLSSDPATLHISRPSSTLGLSSDPTSCHTSRTSSTLGLSNDPTSLHSSRPSSTLGLSSDPTLLQISRPSSLCSTSERTPNIPTRQSPDYNHLNRSSLIKRCSSTPPRSPWSSNASRLSEITFQIDTPDALFDVLSPNTFSHLPRVVSDLPLEIEATAVDVTVLSNIAGAMTPGTRMQGEKDEGPVMSNVSSAMTPGTRMQGEKSEGSVLSNVSSAMTPGTRMQGEKSEGSVLSNVSSAMTPGTRMQGAKSKGSVLSNVSSAMTPSTRMQGEKSEGSVLSNVTGSMTPSTRMEWESSGGTGDSVSCDTLEESKKTAVTYTARSPVNVTSLASTIAPASLNDGRKTRAVSSDVPICRTQATPSLTTTVAGTAGQAPVNSTSVVIATVLSDVAIRKTQATPSVTAAVAETASHAPVNTTPAVIVTSHAYGVAMTATPKPSVATAMGGTGTTAVVCSSGDPICAVTFTGMPVKQATAGDKPVSALGKQATAGDKPVSALGKQPTAGDKPVSALGKQSTAGDKPVSALRKQGTAVDKPVSALGKQPTAGDKPVSALGKQGTAVDKPVSALGKQATAVDKPVSALGKQPTAGDKPVSALGKQGTAVDKPVSALGKQGTAVDKPVSALGKQATAVDKPVSALGKQPIAVDKPVSALGQKPTAGDKPVIALGKQATAVDKPVSALGKQATADDKPVNALTDKPGALRKTVGALGNPVTTSGNPVNSPERSTSIQKPVPSTKRPPTTVLQALEKIQTFQDELQRQIDQQRELLAAKQAQPSISGVVHVFSEEQTTVQTRIPKVAATYQDFISAVSVAANPSSVVASSVATKPPPSSDVTSSVAIKQPPSSDVASSVATKHPSSVVASSVAIKPPPSSDVASSVATKPPPSSVVASSVATKPPPSSDVASSVATKPPPSSDVASSVTAKQPPSSDVASSVATKPPPSSDVASSVTAKQPPSSDVASSVATKPPPSSDVASSVATKPPPSSDVTSSVATKPPPSSDVASSVATKPPPSSDVTSSVAIKQPPSSDVASSVATKPPPSSDVASSVGTKPPPSSVVASSVAIKQPPSSDVASSVATKPPPSSDVASSVTTKPPPFSDVASSVTTKPPPSSVVASSVATKQPPSSDVSSSVTTKQPPSSAMITTLKQPLSKSADPSISGKEIISLSGSRKRTTTKDVPTSNEESVMTGPGSQKRTRGVPASSEESIVSGPGSQKRTKVMPSSSGEESTLASASRKRAGVPVTKETKRQKGERTSHKQNAVMMNALKRLGILSKSMHRTLGQCQKQPQLNVDGVLEKLKPNPPLSTLFLSTARVDNVGSLSSPVFTMPESTLASLEKQERAGLAGEKLRSEGGYTPYSSPLLPLQSYRLSPFYRTHAKLPLSSLTYSNKIDPHKIMCKFELHGICNDPNCTAQHMRDIGLSKQELVQDLVAYAPTLAGCSGRDLEIVDGNMPDLQRKISERVSCFSRNVIRSLAGKLTDEQLFTLTTHDVNKERTKLHPRAVGNFVRLEERYWLMNPRGEREGRSVVMRERLDVGSGGAQVVATEEEGMEITASSGVQESEQKQLSSRRRYFSMGESHVTTALEERVKADPSDVGAWISLAERARGKGRMEEARGLLEEGLKSNQSSEELWVEWLRVKASELSTGSPPATHDQRQQVLDDLCTQAMTACPSYAVVFECIGLAESYDAKQKWMSEGYKEICKQDPPSPSSSHQCLELFLNVILLDQLSGRSDLAVTRFHEALNDRQQSCTHPYTRLLTHLLQEDCVLAYLCLINLEYHGSLPSSVFQPSNTHPPVRLVNKDPFLAVWNKRGLSMEAQQRVRELLDGFRPPIFPSALNAYFSQCIPLYHHLVMFEALHGRRSTAINLLNKLMSLCSCSVELWLLHANVEVKLGDCRATCILNKAVEKCPRRAELYYYGARVELNRGSTATCKVENAVNWLSRCVLQFYHPTPDDGGAPALRESLLLYRKLLGQMVPYDYKPPDFAEGVNPKQLGESLAPLWMCYCLLVELALPTVVPEDFLPTSVEDAFESAVHSVHDSKGMRSLWLEYLSYVRAQVVKEKGSAQSFKVFSNCVQRCLLAVDTRLSHAHHVYGQPKEYHDHSFHNEVVEMFLSCLPYVSSYKLSTLRNLVRKFPKNHLLVARLVECALDQTPEQMELAQDALASYLAEDPRSPLLWRMAIFIELRLNRTREARWMYHHAVKALPFHAELWREFLLFELKQQVSPTPTQNPLLLEVIQKAQQLGVHL